MERASTNHRNFRAAIAVAMLFLVAQFVAPSTHLKQSQLSCGQPSKIIASFPDIRACDNDPRYRTGCACGPVKNELSGPYHFWLIPLLMGLLSYISLKGSIPSRLAFINGAVVFAWISHFIFSLLKEPNPEIAMALLFLPILAAVYCVLVTAWFFVFMAVHSIAKRRFSAT